MQKSILKMLAMMKKVIRRRQILPLILKQRISKLYQVLPPLQPLPHWQKNLRRDQTLPPSQRKVQLKQERKRCLQMRKRKKRHLQSKYSTLRPKETEKWHIFKTLQWNFSGWININVISNYLHTLIPFQSINI